MLQLGPDTTPHNLLTLPVTKTEALEDPLWFDHLCVPGMGDHFYLFNYQPDQDCQEVLPLTVEYDITS